MKKSAYFALFVTLAIGPRAAVAQVADTVPPQRQQRMEMRNQRMADRMGQNRQRMADRRQLHQQRMPRGMRGGFSPSALLMQQRSLGLAPEQVTQLEGLRDQAQAVDDQAQALLTDEQRGRVLGRGDAMRGQMQRGRMRPTSSSRGRVPRLRHRVRRQPG